MTGPYDGLDAATRAALLLDAAALRRAVPAPLEVFDDNGAMIAALARYIEADLAAALAAGRERVAMIVPVGPVGQYDLLARRAGEMPFDRLTLIVMDEYLTDNGDWIAADDPLSFRGHIQRALMDRLPAGNRPELVVPDPRDTGAVGRCVDRLGGVDVCYAGVGITGHLAFNDPLAGVTDPAHVAGLATRIVALAPHTRLINAVTAARGNVERIPRQAVTVGMKEILGARRLRIFMNREWQCAAIRRLACGPVTGAFPASLARTHPDWSLHVVAHVLDPPEPQLR